MKRFIALTFCSLLFTGCVKSSDHDKLTQRVSSLEQFRNETRRALKADLSRAENLSSRLKEAASELRKSGADINVRLDDQEQANRRLKGRLEEVEYLTKKLTEKLDRIGKFLDNRMGFSIIDLPKDLPQNPEGLLQAAEAALKKNDHALTRAIVRKFKDDFGNHADNARALLLLGESYRKEAKYKPALKAYEEIWVHHKDHAVAPMALLYAGHTLRDSNECKKAIQMYRLLSKTFRKMPEAIKAKELYKALQGNCN